MISTGNTENSSPRGSSGKSSSEAMSSGHYLGDKLKTHHQRSHSEGAISRLNQTANDKEYVYQLFFFLLNFDDFYIEEFLMGGL